MTNMHERQEQRIIAIEQARESFERFLASPNADYLCEYLATILRVEPLMRETPEKTAYQIGLFEAIGEIRNIQKIARGESI